MRASGRLTLKPVASARNLGLPAEAKKSKIEQTVELCTVVDKNRTGRINMSNFSRITKVSGL